MLNKTSANNASNFHRYLALGSRKPKPANMRYISVMTGECQQFAGMHKSAYFSTSQTTLLI